MLENALTMEESFLLPVGATVQTDGVAYCVWAPAVPLVRVEIRTFDGKARVLPLQRDNKGYHTGFDKNGRAGDAYLYYLEGKGHFPDPASRAQQVSVHGHSLVVDSTRYRWTDASWCRPSFRDLVIYELHIGTFTEKGTFQSARERLDSLRKLGIMAIEIMPIADFPGNRNWGYDGVLLYAPARCYGTPDDLRALVDCAHSHGLAVILDVVYNHLGPRGNYLACFDPDYFSQSHFTRWGSCFNFDSEMSAPVREFIVHNPLYWMEEFHIDGFRLDATHEICDNSQVHILAEISKAIHKQGGYVIAEDDRNLNSIVQPVEKDGMGFDAVWADDFHHALRVVQTNETFAYFADYDGLFSEVLSTLDCGWLYCGQISKKTGLPRGTPCKHLSPERFIHCISNHDQIGNQAMGQRLSQLISPAAYRTFSALLCFSPYTPLIFMGQEWAASTPFLYFTEHEVELGKQITEGRLREFSEFPEFADPTVRSRIPDPQAESSFLSSRLRWQESERKGHVEIRTLYCECLRLRRVISALRPISRADWRVDQLSSGVGRIHYRSKGREYLIVFDLQGGNYGTLDTKGDWELLLSTEERRFGGKNAIIFNRASNRISFDEKGLAFLTR